MVREAANDARMSVGATFLFPHGGGCKRGPATKTGPLSWQGARNCRARKPRVPIIGVWVCGRAGPLIAGANARTTGGLCLTQLHEAGFCQAAANPRDTGFLGFHRRSRG